MSLHISHRPFIAAACLVPVRCPTLAAAVVLCSARHELSFQRAFSFQTFCILSVVAFLITTWQVWPALTHSNESIARCEPHLHGGLCGIGPDVPLFSVPPVCMGGARVSASICLRLGCMVGITYCHGINAPIIFMIIPALLHALHHGLQAMLLSVFFPCLATCYLFCDSGTCIQVLHC